MFYDVLCVFREWCVCVVFFYSECCVFLVNDVFCSTFCVLVNDVCFIVNVVCVLVGYVYFLWYIMCVFYSV